MPVTIDDKGNASVTCDCGKPLTKVNEYGMFCDDMCGYEESIKASALLDAIIVDTCLNLNIVEVDLSQEEVAKTIKEMLENDPPESPM